MYIMVITLQKKNPWELFFYQPYNFTLEDVTKYANNVTTLECNAIGERPDEINMYYKGDSINFWHDFAQIYMPLKKELLIEADKIMFNLFGYSKNILGVKMRGTDYIAWKPKGHSIPPKIGQVIKDTNMMDHKYNYDFIFFATEDEKIRINFLSAFDNKVKIVTKEDFIQIENYNSGINKVLNYMKNYLLNIIILSKCLDIITSRTSGSSGVFVLTKGFRHSKVYILGTY